MKQKKTNKKPKVVYIADDLDDLDGLPESFIQSRFCDPRNLKFKDINYTFFSLQNGKSHQRNIWDIKTSLIRGAAAVFFDYGGFSVHLGCDNTHLIDMYSRWFIKMIEDNPSIEWWCVTALPHSCFSDDELEHLKELGYVNFAWDS